MVGKYVVLFTIVGSIIAIIRTVYNMNFNYATGLNLATTLILVAIALCLPYFSFRMLSDDSLEEIENRCRLTRVKILRIPKSSL